MSTAELEADLSEDERAGLERVRAAGGIPQGDCWTDLAVSARPGRRLVVGRAEHGLIQREETVYQGHNTYLLTPAPRDLNFSLLMAGDMLPPFVGDEEVDPNSDGFSQWLMNLAYEE
jgi:hypothetical protein